jgi:hypothetical protein
MPARYRALLVIVIAVVGACVRQDDSSKSKPQPVPTEATSITAASKGTVDSVRVGPTLLTLGMLRDEALEQLMREYEVRENATRTASFESWLVWTKNMKTYVANVNLKDGRLSSVIKPWGPSDEHRGVPLAHALYGAISELIGDGRRTCKLDVGETSGPGWTSKGAFIICGERHIAIDILRSEDRHIGERASVTEHLGSSAAPSRLVR